jgi:hypothetical protein
MSSLSIRVHSRPFVVKSSVFEVFAFFRGYFLRGNG